MAACGALRRRPTPARAVIRLVGIKIRKNFIVVGNMAGVPVSAKHMLVRETNVFFLPRGELFFCFSFASPGPGFESPITLNQC